MASYSASPLPDNPPQLQHLPDNFKSAYDICRTAELNTGSLDATIHLRILGYLILYAPTDSGRAHLVESVLSCSNDQTKLSELGQLFMTCLIRHFKKHKGRTPGTSPHSHRSFEQRRQEVEARIIAAPENHTEAKILALERDGRRCVVTGVWDDSAYYDPSMKKTMPSSRVALYHTECAHILPTSTFTNLNEEEKIKYLAGVLGILKSFGYDIVSLNGPQVHSLENVMTLEWNVHEAFNCLELWFERLERTDNHYNIITFNGMMRHDKQRDSISFHSMDPKYALPDPQLLALHAACAKVAHLSGAAKRIDQLDRDLDEMGVLAADGGSFDVLSHALLPFVREDRE